MSQQINRAILIAVRLLGRVRLFPNRLFLVHICPEKLIEFDEIVAMADLNPDDSILDIGCGIGEQTLLLGKKSKLAVGIDLSKSAIERAEVLARASMLSDSVRFLNGDVVEFNFSSNSFTKIVSFCVLEHVPDWRRVLKNAHEWLAPNGILVVSVDSLATIQDEAIISKHRKEHSVITYFDRQTLESALREAGFSHVELHSILKSDCAKELFTRNVTRNSFGGLNMLRLLIEYARLRKAERAASGQDKGIFLIARATH